MTPQTNLTYCLVSTNFGVILDIAFDILAPDGWVVIVWSKELGNILRSRTNSLEPFLPEDTGQVLLNGSNGGSGNMVTEDPN